MRIFIACTLSSYTLYKIIADFHAIMGEKIIADPTQAWSELFEKIFKIARSRSDNKIQTILELGRSDMSDGIKLNKIV